MKTVDTDQKALVLLSGGQDSMTCLYWSRQQFSTLEALFFHYEQRHHLEYDSASRVATDLQIPLHELHVPAFSEIGGSAMIEDIDITETEAGLPNTFVPGRNIVFLTLAASLAYTRGIGNIVIGVNQMDYSGYPDCRSDFILSMQDSLRLGLDFHLRLHTPLSSLDKAGIWALADDLGVFDIIVQQSHTCYLGDRRQFNPWGYGCGSCPACRLRADGYKRYLERKNGKVVL